MIVLPKGSHLNGHIDHGLLIHPQTQTLELHAISTKLSHGGGRGGGGGGGGGSLVWLCLSVLQMLTPFQTKDKYVTPSRGSLENHTRFRTNMDKIYTRCQTKTCSKTLPFSWQAHTLLMEVVSFLGTICFTVIPCVVRERVNHNQIYPYQPFILENILGHTKLFI